MMIDSSLAMIAINFGFLVCIALFVFYLKRITEFITGQEIIFTDTHSKKIHKIDNKKKAIEDKIEKLEKRILELK